MFSTWGDLATLPKKTARNRYKVEQQVSKMRVWRKGWERSLPAKILIGSPIQELKSAMGLGGILILLLLLVSLIVFIYFIVMTARGWGVLHTILLCTLFIECWVFMVFAAGVQDRRVRYTKEAQLAQKKAEDALARTTQLLYGNFDASGDARKAVIPVRGMVRRLAAARGRVWRQLLYLQNNNSEFLLELSTGRPAANADGLEETEPAAPATPAATIESLPAELVVYAFAESVNEQGHPRPEFYLGEFKILQSQAGQVTLTPTLPLQSFQQEYIASGSATSWMLYELMPVDSHVAFAAEGSEPTPEAIFGRMDPETIAALFANIPTENNLQQKIIDSYVRDGTRATGDDELASLWVQVNMLKNHEIDVDSEEEANATVGSYYDSIGRSVDSRLKREEGSSVELTPEMNTELIVLKEEAAQELISAGKAELVQRIYVRPLNDYEEAFNQYVLRAQELFERITLVRRESSEIAKANEFANEMITFRQVENQKLTSDLSNVQKEIAVLNDSLTTANGQLTELRKQMSQLYRTIQAKRNQLPL